MAQGQGNLAQEGPLDFRGGWEGISRHQARFKRQKMKALRVFGMVGQLWPCWRRKRRNEKACLEQDVLLPI